LVVAGAVVVGALVAGDDVGVCARGFIPIAPTTTMTPAMNANCLRFCDGIEVLVASQVISLSTNAGDASKPSSSVFFAALQTPVQT